MIQFYIFYSVPIYLSEEWSVFNSVPQCPSVWEEWWVYFITRSFNWSICSLFMYNIIAVWWFSSVTQEKEFCYDISWPFFFPPNGIVQRLDRKVSVYTAQQKYISEPFRICLWEKDCKHTLNSRISRPAKWRTKHCNYPN